MTFHAILSLFTQPQAGEKSAPPVYEYPILLLKALNVVRCTHCVYGDNADLLIFVTLDMDCSDGLRAGNVGRKVISFMHLFTIGVYDVRSIVLYSHT